MKSKTKLIIGSLVFILVLLLSSVLYRSLSKNYQPDNRLKTDSKNSSTEDLDNSDSKETEATLAPDFSVTDADGNTVKLSDFSGKPVVVNVWASWCPPCKEEMPDFDKVYQELGEDVVFMMINATDGTRETKELAEKFISQSGYSFPVYYDTSQEVSYTYGISSLPSSIFIDKDGYLITGAVGMIDEKTLRKGIDMILPDS